ncbi:hypothetical protein B4U80_00889 [Leptotrombidium deliense]|uniref:Uncharacterized protein n=1 Tax=Leptotrombidium deliense TaxID=299467 RepID=A0A443SMF8_9ACAR|nr:hypothetical protein B4U80_00889 [Leptotrombidium deliense]
MCAFTGVVQRSCLSIEMVAIREMWFLTKCWAPCFTIKSSNRVSLRTGCVLIAVYTALLHLLSLSYVCYVLNGGRSDNFYSPLFEFSRFGMVVICCFTIVYSILFIFCCSLALVYGVKTEIRFLYLPWIWCTALELLFLLFFGFFVIYRYYHYLWATFAWLILWSYGGYHTYLFLVVLSQYYYLKDIQEPTFIILYP